MPDFTEVERLFQREVAALRQALGSLITWMAQAATSPISRHEAASLLRMMTGEEP